MHHLYLDFIAVLKAGFRVLVSIRNQDKELTRLDWILHILHQQIMSDNFFKVLYFYINRQNNAENSN